MPNQKFVSLLSVAGEAEVDDHTAIVFAVSAVEIATFPVPPLPKIAPHATTPEELVVG